MKQNKKFIIFGIILSILLSGTISFGATTMKEWGFPRTGEIYIKESIKGKNPHETIPEYSGYYEIGIGGSAGGAAIYGALQSAEIEDTADNYTFTIMKSVHRTNPNMIGRSNPHPGSLEVDEVQRSYYLPYRHDYVFKYDSKTREGRLPIWYIKSVGVENRVPIDSVKSELEEMERKLYDISYLAYKIKAQGEPRKSGDYHPTHALLLEEYAKDYRKIFWATANYIYYTREQITESTKVLDKVIEWVENNRIQPMEILDYKVGEHSGIINRDEKKIDVYLPSGYEINESDIKIQLPDWMIARKRPGEFKLNGSVRYFLNPIDALYENFPQDVSSYAIFQDWTINFIEISEKVQPQLNSLFYINSNGERIYAVIDENNIQLNIPNYIEEDEIPVNIYYFGRQLFRVEDGVEEKISNPVLLPLDEDIKLKIVEGDEENSKIYTLKIESIKSDENSILDFFIEGIETEIDNNSSEIILYPNFVDDISQLKPSIVTSYKSRIEPASQLDQDFNEIKEYTVTSESGKSRIYDIRVERAPASAENEIKGFRIGTINGAIEGNIITVKLPSNINLKDVQPTIEISQNATVYPASGAKVDLSGRELLYTVTAENGTDIREYKLIVEIDHIEVPGVDPELLKELRQIRDNIYQRYKNSSALTDDWDWMNIGLYEGINNGIGPDGVRRDIEDLPGKYNMHGQIGKLASTTMTDLDRFTMSATAMGIDATNLSKYTTSDKPFKFKDGKTVNNMIAEIYSKQTIGGINGAAFSLIALDMGNYTVPEDANFTRENILDELLNLPLDQQFDVDMVGMVMQSLYPYKDHPAYGERVNKHLDYAMDLILGQVPAKYVHPMKSDFTFESWGTVNSESMAQVICGLTTLGIDPHTDYRFSDNEKSLITQWLDKFLIPERNGFGHNSKTYDHMATYQSMYALQWYINFLENGGAGHPYSLYYDVPFDFGRKMSSEAEIIFFELLGKQGEIDHDRGIITVIIPENTDDSKLVDEPIIRINDGSRLTPEIGSIEDFRDDIVYTVTSEDGKTKKDYRIVVEKKAGVLSGEREIEEIKISGISPLSTVIDRQNRQISIRLSSDVNKDDLRSVILNLKHSGADITPDPEEPKDYTKAVIFTITAEDGQTAEYTITVLIDEADKYEFTKFVLRGVEGKIDPDKNEIVINLPIGAYVENIKPNQVEYEPRESTTSIVPAPTILRHFENENLYKIVPYPADNTVEYNVRLNYVNAGGNGKITKFTIGNHNAKVEGKSIILQVPGGMTESKFKEELKDEVPKIEWDGMSIDPMPDGENSLEDYLKDYVLSDSEGNVNLYAVKFTGGSTNPGSPDPDDPNNPDKDAVEITSFSVNGIKATIDNGNGRIFLEIPFEMENFIVFPAVTLSEGTSISPDMYRPIDLRKTNIFTLRKGDIFKQYVLIVRKAEPKPATLLWRYMEEDLNIPYYQRVE